MDLHLPDHDLLATALQQHRLLGQLDAAARTAWLARLQPRRFAPREPIADGDSLGRRLLLLAAGQATLRGTGGGRDVVTTLRLEAPDWLGAGVQRVDPALQWQLTADSESLVGFLPAEELAALAENQPLLQAFMAPPPPTHAAGADPHVNLMNTPVRSMIKREPVTVPPRASIREVAELMRAQRVSSVLLVEQGHLFGLVTDRDLRNRALAVGLDPAQPVIDIATVAPLTIPIESPGFEALLLMARHNIHHVPVMDEGRVAGMITATDVTEQHGTSAVYLAGDIHKQTTLEGLTACAAKVRTLQRQLSAAGASAYSTGHIVTAITDALTSRLLHLGEARLGPPPIEYAWVAAGSQARHEQTAKSDQDNCMLLDDAYDPVAHGTYFKELATWVCDGLAACGYIHCPGEIMAMTDQWRQPRRVWAETFRKWIDTPEPKALMLSCVFFDVRTIAGPPELLDGLRRTVLQRTRDNRLFLAHMVSNALSRQPPLGMFGGMFGSFSTIRSGEHKGTVDLKHTGIVPVIDLARVYALAAGNGAINTHDRLAHAAESGEISSQGVHDLRDALEYLSITRIRHQARQISAGHEADNHLRPDELSNFERSQLKDAFGVVKSLQDVLAQRYQVGRF
jgi:CBS domain-containing protein